jgi:hypothetical protein
MMFCVKIGKLKSPEKIYILAFFGIYLLDINNQAKIIVV